MKIMILEFGMQNYLFQLQAENIFKNKYYNIVIKLLPPYFMLKFFY